MCSSMILQMKDTFIDHFVEIFMHFNDNLISKFKFHHILKALHLNIIIRIASYTRVALP